MTIRVLLADDQALIRAGYRLILDSEPDIKVVGEAIDGREAVHLARNWPDGSRHSDASLNAEWAALRPVGG